MDLDLYGLKVFSQVMSDKTFSEAARSLRVSQPAVSQQIAKLESHVGKLFQRVGHQLVPTPLAFEFQSLASEMLERMETFEQKLQIQRNTVQGLVRYAMPESCQWTPHYKSIMKKLSSLPEVRFQIHILPNEQITQALMEARLDFAFVVGERVSPELRFQKFSHEVYSAVGRDAALFAPLSPSGRLEELRLVTYPGWELFFTTWAKHHGITSRQLARIPSPVVHIGTLAGAIHAIQQGAGIGIIPTHCVASELQEKSLHEWNSKKAERAYNPIYLAKRVGEKLPKRVETTIEMLIQAKLKDAKE